jgi:hypothetical protein
VSFYDMSTVPDRALRDALEHLTAAPPPTDLARTAIRRAHRRRFVHRAGLAAAVAAFVPALVAAIMAIPGGRTASTAPGTILPGGRVVVAYTGIDPDGGQTDPGPANDTSLLLNFDTGDYASVPYSDVVPPTTRRAGTRNPPPGRRTRARSCWWNSRATRPSTDCDWSTPTRWPRPS